MIGKYAILTLTEVFTEQDVDDVVVVDDDDDDDDDDYDDGHGDG